MSINISKITNFSILRLPRIKLTLHTSWVERRFVFFIIAHWCWCVLASMSDVIMKETKIYIQLYSCAKQA